MIFILGVTSLSSRNQITDTGKCNDANGRSGIRFVDTTACVSYFTLERGTPRPLSSRCIDTARLIHERILLNEVQESASNDLKEP